MASATARRALQEEAAASWKRSHQFNCFWRRRSFPGTSTGYAVGVWLGALVRRQAIAIAHSVAMRASVASSSSSAARRSFDRLPARY